MRSARIVCLATCLALGAGAAASDHVLYDENSSPDLSNDPLAPTNLGALKVGSNTLRAQFNSAQPDFFTITVPEGAVLDRLRLLSWGSQPFEDIAFTAFQRGEVYWAETPRPFTADGILGWSHLRSTQVGSPDILFEFALASTDPRVNGVAEIYEAEAENAYEFLDEPQRSELRDALRNLTNTWVAGAAGFEVPLGAGPYTFWLRQGSSTIIDVELEYVVRLVEPAESRTRVTLAVSERSNRSLPEPLDGARLDDDDNVYVHLLPLAPSGVESVRFFIDGQFERQESFAPYDLAGTRSNTRAAAFDTDELFVGEHTITAEVRFEDGSSEIRSAVFFVGGGGGDDDDDD